MVSTCAFTVLSFGGGDGEGEYDTEWDPELDREPADGDRDPVLDLDLERDLERARGREVDVSILVRVSVSVKTPVDEMCSNDATGYTCAYIEVSLGVERQHAKPTTTIVFRGHSGQRNNNKTKTNKTIH